MHEFKPFLNFPIHDIAKSVVEFLPFFLPLSVQRFQLQPTKAQKLPVDGRWFLFSFSCRSPRRLAGPVQQSMGFSEALRLHCRDIDCQAQRHRQLLKFADPYPVSYLRKVYAWNFIRTALHVVAILTATQNYKAADMATGNGH